MRKMHLDYRIISSAIFIFRIDKTRIVGVEMLASKLGTRVTQSVKKE